MIFEKLSEVTESSSGKGETLEFDDPSIGCSCFFYVCKLHFYEKV